MKPACSNNLSKKVVLAQQGFSLIEILLTIVLTGFLLYLLSTTPSSLRLIGNSQHSTIAKEIMQKKIEDLRLQGYDNLSNGTTQMNDSQLYSLPSGYGILDIQDCPTDICTRNEQVKKVTMTISWKDVKATNSAQLVTFIAKYGL